jgi:XTP/dITP diphosphohydrolase
LTAPASIPLIVSSRNPHKLAELTRILGPLGLALESAADAGVPDVEETGSTYLDNALLKAAAAWETVGGAWCLADDSGLSVDHLDGGPGVYSARFAGEDVTYEDNNALLLETMKDVPTQDRGAEFVCTLALLVPREVPEASSADGWSRVVDHPGVPSGATAYAIEGRIRGEITRAAAGGSGFGYDPLFYVATEGMTFAELTPDRKNAISHRGIALGHLERCIASIRAI